MSSISQVIFFKQAHATVAVQCFVDFVNWAKLDSYLLAMKTPSESLDQEAECRGDSFQQEDFDGSTPLLDYARRYSTTYVMVVDVGVCPISTQFSGVFQKAIPHAVRGDFVPGELRLTLGPQKLIDYAFSPSGAVLGASSFSIDFFGYGTPPEYSQIQEMVQSTSGMCEFRRRLESVVGDLNCCFISDV